MTLQHGHQGYFVFNREAVTKAAAYAALSLLIAVVSFPQFEPEFGAGIDAPLLWVFNYIFAHDPSLGRNIAFPFGPFSFLTGPLPIGNNLWIAAFAHTALAVTFCVNMLSLAKAYEQSEWLAPALLLVLLLHILNFMMLMIGVFASFFLLALRSENWRYAIPGMMLCAFALFVKSYSGVIGLATAFLFAGLFVWRFRRWREAALLLALLPFTFALTWLLLYGNLSVSLRYVYALSQMSSGNNSAMALFPPNDWIALGIAAAAFLVIPLIHRHRDANDVYLLMAMATFGAWKHAMTRQDFVHARGLVLYLLLFFALLLVCVPRKRYWTLVLAVVAIGTVHYNLRNVLWYAEWRVQALRVNAFVEFFWRHNGFVNDYETRTRDAIAWRRLDSALVSRVGNRSVDVYPWDYSFLPANGFSNWRPRPVIQSYAAYTPWLDNENKTFFASADAPEMLLWELPHRGHPGTFESIDDRYVLNDEPETMLTILDRYALVSKTETMLLLQNKNANNLGDRRIVGTTETTWNTWIDVPRFNDGILRVNVGTKNNLIGALKTFLYKNEVTHVYALLENNTVVKHRFVPTNARGLWINPLVMHAETGAAEPAVRKIMFRCSNAAMMKERFTVEWELVTVHNNTTDTVADTNAPANAWRLFGKTAARDSSAVYTTGYDRTFPNNDSGTKQTAGDFFSAPHAYTLPSGHSTGFRIPFDSLKITNRASKVRIMSSLWAKPLRNEHASLVISVMKGTESLFWHDAPLRDRAVATDDWNCAVNDVVVDANVFGDDCILMVYLWNNDTREVLFDDFNVAVEAMP